MPTVNTEIPPRLGNLRPLLRDTLQRLPVRFVLVTMLVFGLIGGFSVYFAMMMQKQQFLKSLEDRAVLLARTIYNGIVPQMLHGGGHSLQDVFESSGVHKEILSLEIFNEKGVITTSSNKDRIGRSVEPDRLNLAFHGSDPVFRMARRAAGEVMDIHIPIPNEPKCHSCHGSSPRTLGVLEVELSAASVSRNIAVARRFLLGSSVLMICALILAMWFLMHRLVLVPIHAMGEAIARVEHGNLDVTVPVTGVIEFQMLARNFNSMVDRLNNAKREIEANWAENIRHLDKLANLGEFASSLAHEIKNPLTGLAGAVQLLRGEQHCSATHSELLEEMYAQIRRIDKTVSDLLSLVRRPRPSPKPFDLNVCIESVLILVRQMAGDKGIALQQKLKRSLPPVNADYEQIQQVILNISLNAIQAMEQGGALSVSTGDELKGGRRFVCVTFRDNGVGILAENMEKIFRPFFTTKPKGTGLGLAICRQILSEHQGDITVRSEPGRWAEFVAWLPAASEPATEGGMA